MRVAGSLAYPLYDLGASPFPPSLRKAPPAASASSDTLNTSTDDGAAARRAAKLEAMAKKVAALKLRRKSELSSSPSDEG